MKRLGVAVGFLGLALSPQRSVIAQQSFVGLTSGVFRYHGDTLWVLRDTTETRVIYHGDTVTRRLSIDGRLRSEMKMVVHGDSAFIVAFRDPSGERPIPSMARAVPASSALVEREMLATEVRLDASRRLGAQSGDADPLEIPMVSESARTYVVSPATRIIQHGDTLRFLSGCPTSRVDTTVFRLFGADSVRRLSEPARTFGQPMAVTLINQMRVTVARERISTAAPNILPGVPMPRDPCAK
jgi:hypothetical protein